MQATYGIVSASIAVPGKVYSIVGIARGDQKEHILRQSDPTRFPSDLSDAVSPQSQPQGKEQRDAPTTTPSRSTSKYLDRVSILVLHTPAVAASIQNGDPNVDPLPTINARVDEVVGQVAQAFVNSRAVPVSVRNVRENFPNRSEEITYSEANGQICRTSPPDPPPVPTAAQCRFFGHRVFLRNSAFAQARRNALSADLVVMLVNDNAACGVAYTQRDSCGIDNFFGSNEPGCTVGAGYNAFAYAVVNFGCSSTMRDFAHEVGHTFGMEHNSENFDPGLATPSFPWSFARWVVNEQETIMSLRGKFGLCGICTKAIQYSNSDVGFTAFPGTASGSATQYNARTAAAFATTMSEFRDPQLQDLIFRTGMEQLPCTGTGVVCHP